MSGAFSMMLNADHEAGTGGELLPVYVPALSSFAQSPCTKIGVTTDTDCSGSRMFPRYFVGTSSCAVCRDVSAPAPSAIAVEQARAGG